MKARNVRVLVAALILGGMTGSAMIHADETMGEKAAATANDAARSVKKGTHRAEEAVCMESDTKCLEQKAKHRAEEASDYTKDKAKEAKNAVDSDGKK